jgi:hypothetical protein
MICRRPNSAGLCVLAQNRDCARIELVVSIMKGIACMTLPVDIRMLAEAIGTLPAEATGFIGRTTGEILAFTEEELMLADSGEVSDVVPAWQQEAIALARRVLASDDFLAVPNRFDIHEYAMMERYCHTIADDRIRASLAASLKGRGAFRRFRNCIHREGLAEDWYRYRDRALEEIARDFLDAHGIPHSGGQSHSP